MNHPCRLVVRQNTKTGRTLSGFASTLPRLSAEWRDIGEGSLWYGAQMKYGPFRAAREKAQAMAAYYSGLASGS
jgi:hypothetical protein